MGIEDRDADDDNGDGEYSIALAHLTARNLARPPAVGLAGKLSRLTVLMRPAVWATTTGP